MQKMPPEKAIEAVRAILNRPGGLWKECLKQTGWTDWSLRALLDPSFKQRKAIEARRRRGTEVSRRIPLAKNARPERLSAGWTTPHPPVPQSVQFERDRAMLAPRSLTAALLGDPPAGRSALDRRHNA